MGIEQGSDGYWRDTNDTSNSIGYATRDDAIKGYGLGGGGGGFEVSTGDTIAAVGFFAILAAKIYLWFIKKGIIPCLGIAGGATSLIGIPYGLITKTQFAETGGNIFWVFFLVFFVVGVVAWNVGNIWGGGFRAILDSKVLKLIFVPQCVMFLLAMVWIFLTVTETISVPDYMYLTRQAERVAGSSTLGGLNLKYKANAAGNGIIITQYMGKKIKDYKNKGSKTVVIPDVIDGLPVVGIAAEAFRARDILQVTLPKNLKFIGNQAFSTSGLTSIIIPDGVTDIGESAFNSCNNLTSVSLPKGLKRRGLGAFANTPADNELKKKIPSAVKEGQYLTNKAYNSVLVEEMGVYFFEGKSSPLYQ